jgi:hypothetical protein
MTTLGSSHSSLSSALLQISQSEAFIGTETVTWLLLQCSLIKTEGDVQGLIPVGFYL